MHAFGSYLLVTWSAPAKTIGVVTQYELGVAKYGNIQNGTGVIPRSVTVGPEEFRVLLRDLEYGTKYALEIAANTTLGRGQALRKTIKTIKQSGEM